MGKRDWVKMACACSLSLLCATAASTVHAQTFKTLHSFDKTDGAFPSAGLVQATDGKLYGTTAVGGSSSACSFGCGTIFKISAGGALTTIYSFCSLSGCTDGGDPVAGLVQAADRNFYGTTDLGGADNAGTVFRITPSGTLTTLFSFQSQGLVAPSALIQATDGNLYGVTSDGGNNAGGTFCPLGCGTIFKVSPGGAETTVYEFCSQGGCADGRNPTGPLVQAADGSFYGTTGGGGASGASGVGTVFQVSPGGTLTTLHSFDSTDGAGPTAILQGTDGNFYGTTGGGGANGLGGTIFQITPEGALTTLYSFCSQTLCRDGQLPVGLVQATDGNLYGTTRDGGATGMGTVFEITTGGRLTTIHNFCPQRNCAGGRRPEAAPAQDTNGNLYGTADLGGASDFGTVFALSVGLGPFVETQTTFGKVGAAVKILGTDLTGATSVTFNGTAATFTVKSASLIATTVPAGATTGTVQVVTPSGTLSSNVPFQVVP